MNAPAEAVGWRGHLALRYWRDGQRTVALDRHEGPLRVLQRLYPEGDTICHHVLVHPPGGVAGGDSLLLEADLAQGTHAVITTPGATRFYRSGGRPALQQARLRLADGARAEWLPLENLAFSGCEAENRTEVELTAGAEIMGWDLLALGLPASGAAFESGCFTQHLAVRLSKAQEMPCAPRPPVPAIAPEPAAHSPQSPDLPHALWLERGRVDAQDHRLLDSPLGWGGRRVLGTAWWAAGQPLGTERRQALLDAARDCAEGAGLEGWTGVTSPMPHVVVARVLAPRVEPAMQWLSAVRATWRRTGWGLDAHPPRIWRT
ncbi:MAG: urease accessory protein UreD [Betaproteobacteria bacterium]